jgi:HlyD family secretion protein
LFRKWGLPNLAVLGLFMGLYMVHRGNKHPPVPPIPFMPPRSAYQYFIAGSGMLEASSENVPIGVPIGQVVEQVFVHAGDLCKKGDPLFQLNSQVIKARLEVAIAQKEVAKSQLEKLIIEPRPEEVPPLEFAMQSSEAMWQQSLAILGLYQNVTNTNAISQNEFLKAKYAERSSFYSYKQAAANLELKLAGAWIEDITVASRNLSSKEKEVEVVRAELDQTLITAPFDGQVLQVKLYPGSYAQPYYDVPYTDCMMLYGRIDPLHVRINIDEEDAWRFKKGAPATCYVRGNAKLLLKASFVRIEPFIVPKRFLTGDNSEQTDTRVFQVIYQVDRGDLPVYIGQVMDVYIEAEPCAI